jgi:hypothetical protein
MDIEAYKRVREWRNQLHTIFEDVLGLHHSRHIFRDARAIYEANPVLQCDYLFINWLTKNYAESLAVGIRRQADDRRDVISLARLLLTLEAHARKLTRAWYVSESLRRAPRDDRLAWERNANRVFDEFAPAGAPYVSTLLIKRDQRLLQSIDNSVGDFVNRRLAHHSARDKPEAMTVLNLHTALDQVGELLKRYHLLLEQAGLTGAEPTIQTDWKAVLRVSWIQQS